MPHLASRPGRRAAGQASVPSAPPLGVRIICPDWGHACCGGAEREREGGRDGERERAIEMERCEERDKRRILKRFRTQKAPGVVPCREAVVTWGEVVSDDFVRGVIRPAHISRALSLSLSLSRSLFFSLSLYRSVPGVR